MYKNVNTVSDEFFRTRLQWRHSTPVLSMTSLSLAAVYCASTLLGRCLCKRVDVCIITLSCTWQIYALSERLIVITVIICLSLFIVLDALSALMLLIGWQEGHPACKNWVVRYWRGYLSGARCRFAYGPADATAIHCLLLQKDGFIFLVPAHLCSSGQKAVVLFYVTAISALCEQHLWSINGLYPVSWQYMLEFIGLPTQQSKIHEAK